VLMIVIAGSVDIRLFNHAAKSSYLANSQAYISVLCQVPISKFCVRFYVETLKVLSVSVYEMFYNNLFVCDDGTL